MTLVERAAHAAGEARARSHCRFVLSSIHFIPDSLTYSVPLYLKRQCDRTLGEAPQSPTNVFVFSTEERFEDAAKGQVLPRIY